MWKRIVLCALMTLGIGLSAQAETRVVVLPFDVPPGVPMPTLGTATMDALITALTRVPDFIVLARGDLQQVLNEQALSQTGLVDTATAVRMGRLLGAQALITGRVHLAGSDIRLVATFVDVTTGQVRHSEQATGPLTSVFGLLDQLAASFISQAGVTLSAQQAERIKGVFRSTSNLTALDWYEQGRNAVQTPSETTLQQAVDAYGRALDVDPHYGLALTGRATALAEWANLRDLNGQPSRDLYDRALADARRALAESADQPEALRTMAAVLFTQNDTRAGWYVSEALRLAPNDADALLLRWLMGEQDPDAPDILAALQINPRLTEAHTLRGWALDRRGRHDEALAEMQAAVRAAPRDSLAACQLGSMLLHQGRFADGAKALDEAIRLNPNLAIFHSLRAQALRKIGQSDEALTSVRRALTLAPNATPIHQALGEILLSRGDAAGAAEAARKAISLFQDANPTYFKSDRGDIYALLARALLASGHQQEAATNARQAIAQNAEKASYHRLLGDILMTRGEYQAAAESLQRALRLDPRDRDTEHALKRARDRLTGR
jgi:tetratricopeptide (TPR) repeat protein/TolB-like protein